MGRQDLVPSHVSRPWKAARLLALRPCLLQILSARPSGQVPKMATGYQKQLLLADRKRGHRKQGVEEKHFANGFHNFPP